MDRTTELALASTYVYSRERVNRVGIPPGWQVAQVAGGQEAYLKDDSVGFSAGAFLDASGNIVIAFTGTNEFADWVTANIPGALGVRSPQVEHALAFVSDVLARYEGEGKSVTFTGHSLGGGLASLMAVFFGQEAHIFDPAPFQASALIPETLLSYALFYATYQDKLNRTSDAAFAAYLVNPIARFAERQADVSATVLSGETLGLLRAEWSGIYSSVASVDVTASSLFQRANALPSAELLALLPLAPATATDLAKAAFNAATALHSVDLLTLLLDSPSLLQAAQQTPKLLELMLADDLYGLGVSSKGQDFVANLVRHHFGVPGGLAGADPLGADRMADKFGTDVLRLGAPDISGMPAVADGVLATLIEAYQASPSAPADGYVQVADGVATIAFASLPSPDHPKGRDRFADAVGQYAGQPHSEHVAVMALAANQWIVQASASPLNSSGTSNDDVLLNYAGDATNMDGGGGSDLLIDGDGHSSLRGGVGDDVLIGGGGNNSLDGGSGVDYLVGGNDIDVIYGGTGNDELYGGAEADEYYFTAGDGSDIIQDSDGDGKIFVDGVELTVGDRTSPFTWYSADANHRFIIQQQQLMLLPEHRSALIIHDRQSALTITIQGWAAGEFGINLTGLYPNPGATAGDVIPGSGGGSGLLFSASDLRQIDYRDYFRSPGARWTARPIGTARYNSRQIALTEDNEWPPATQLSGTGDVRSYLDMDNLRGSTGNASLVSQATTRWRAPKAMITWTAATDATC